MAEVPKVQRVRAEDLKRGAAVERHEHPWASPATAKKIATDHLKENAGYYGKTGDRHPANAGTVVILNQNVKAIAPHKRKKPIPQQKEFNIMTWGNELIR